jgi:predicted transcriptional regulator with HTH domain
MHDENADGPDIGRVYRPLDNSDVRRDVFGYLCSIYPGTASVDDISMATGHDKVEVVGALTGYRLRYRKEDSLVRLGLASSVTSMIDGKPVQVFSVPESALGIKTGLKDYAFRLSPGTDPGLLRKLRDKVWKR